MAIAGTAILAVALVGFRLSQGGLDYSACAHNYDINDDQVIDTGDVHLEIDKIKDGDHWCDPVDTEDEVEVDSQYEIAVCLTSSPMPPAGFNVDVVFDPELNECVVEACTGACLDGNPDANVGDELGHQVPTDPDLGTGWNCNNQGIDPPRCEKVEGTPGRAYIQCLNPAGELTLPVGAQVSEVIFVVTFRASAEGTDVLSLENVALFDEELEEIMSCSEEGDPCFGATDEKVPPPPATATPTTPPTATPTATSTPAPGVRMEKDANVLEAGVQSTANLWIMAEGCVVEEEGKGCLVIEKRVFEAWDADSPNDSDEDPEGVGAWEEQIKYEHKIVDIDAVPDNTWLESGGRIANCSMTILTENWILTGCVTKDDPAEAGMQLGPSGDGLIEMIYVYPDTNDLIYRDGFRPTKDNGVLTDIVDENCEVTDIYGEQIPGTLPGGLTTVCADAHITVRMLQADLDLDCDVDVTDDQAIAFRYGSFFGLLLYDQWFDLEPKFADFDIDIKDLQFVFGRNYSTCQAPIPDDQADPLDPPQP